jgi:hypothetical protein
LNPNDNERAFSGTSPLPITQEGQLSGPLSCGIVLDRTQARLGLVGWHKHWIEIAPVCILVISHLLDHSFTELFLEIGRVSRYMSVKVQRSKDAFSS